jgi:hypothetical protein
MTGFVNVQFPKCTICLNGFGLEDVPMAHREGEGEKHPFHGRCLQNLINAGNQPDPIYGVQPIRCPVCQIVLPRSLYEDPIRNPSSYVQAASNQLSGPASVPIPAVSSSATELDDMQPQQGQYNHPFDQFPLDAQIRKINESFIAGLISEDARVEYIGHLQAIRG